MASHYGTPWIELSPLMTSHKANSGVRRSKKRASKACQLCRLRKVRCNMTAFGPPCSNCKCDRVNCVEIPRRRRVCQRNTDNLASGLSTPKISSIEPFDFENLDTYALTSEYSRLSAVVDFLLEGTDLESFKVIDDGNGGIQDPMLSSDDIEAVHSPTEGDAYVPNFEARPIPSIEEILPELNTTVETNTAALDPDTRPQIQKFLPCNMKPIPEHLKGADMQYLCNRGVFTIPDIEARDQLLGAYIEHVHPHLPMINLQEFWDDLSVTNPTGRTSLMLLQATLLAASTCVDMDVLRDIGFKNREEAVETFYERTAVLYKLGYESDRPTLLQSLILLAYATATRENDKGGRYWLNIAIGCAYQVGLNKNVFSSQPMVTQRLLRRIWWCCFVQDRLLALQSRTRAHIYDGDFNTPLIAIADFDILDIQIFPSHESGMKSLGTEEQTHIALFFIQKAKLCFSIGHVVNARYSLLSWDPFGGRQQNDFARADAVSDTTKSIDHGISVEECDFELSVWMQSLPDACSKSLQRGYRTGQSWMTLHRGILHILYWVTVTALHKPYSSSPYLDQAAGDMKPKSFWRVQEASFTIEKVLLELYSADLVRKIPVNVMQILVPVVIDKLMVVGSPRRPASQNPTKHLSVLSRVLEQLAEFDLAAKNALNFLRALVR